MGMDPVSWGFIIAAVVSAGGAVYAGAQEEKAAKKNERIALDAAAAAKEKAAYEEAAHRERVRKLISSQRAAYGKSGVDTTGTPLLVLEDTAKQGELDALAIRYGGDVEEARRKSEASLYKLQGNTAKTSGYIGAGKSLLSGYGRVMK
jgi:hypothetical protein